MDAVAALRTDVSERPGRAAERSAKDVDGTEKDLARAGRRCGDVPIVPGLSSPGRTGIDRRQGGDFGPGRPCASPQMRCRADRTENIGYIRRRLDAVDR